VVSAAIWYESDGYAAQGNPPIGRRVAGQGFPAAYARHGLTAGLATAAVTWDSRAKLTAAAETEVFEARLALKIAGLDVLRMPPLATFRQLRETLRNGSQDLETLLGAYGASGRDSALRGLLLMAKLGLVAFEAPPSQK
jgi:hypothetical protein